MQERDAKMKMKYYVRLKHMAEERIARKVYNYVRSERVENAWERRIRELKGWVGVTERRGVSRKEEEAKVAAAISRRGYEEWRGEIEKRGSLKYYKKKTRIGMTDWYNGSRGGELLLHARTGSLCTEGKIARNKGKGGGREMQAVRGWG